MNGIFISFLLASVLHIFEEYIIPGGFINLRKKFNPKLIHVITLPAIIIINGLQVLLAVIIIFVGKSNLAFSLSIAGLLFVNGVIHIIAAFRKRGYASGLITGMCVYLPLLIYAYYHFINSRELKLK